MKNFPQFLVIHMVKGFGIVNKVKVLYCTVPHRLEEYSIFISCPGCPEASIKAAVMQLIVLVAYLD